MYNRLLIIICLLSSPFITGAVRSEIISELRLGVLAHDVGKNFEKGQDINAEVLFTSPQNAVFDFIWSPRPHIGASVNLEGATHQFYGGLTWHWDFWEPLFVEASFGGEAHSGKTGTKSSKHKALGSRMLFRESISLGFTFAQNHTLSIMLDHASNASLANNNPGLTNLGVRYGYKF